VTREAGNVPAAKPRTPRYPPAVEVPELVRLGLSCFASLLDQGSAPTQSDARTSGTGRSVSQLSVSHRDAAAAVLRAALPRVVPRSMHGALARLRLFDDRFCGVQNVPLLPAMPAVDNPNLDQIGQLLEAMLRESTRAGQSATFGGQSLTRKRLGAYFTPPSLVDTVLSTALEPWITANIGMPRVCDPAMGAGAFLLGVARRILETHRSRADVEATDDDMHFRTEIVRHLYGIDIEPLAVAAAEAMLWAWTEDPTIQPDSLQAQLCHGDALMSERLVPDDFDLVVGNPPWVAFAGRAAQRLSPELRRTFVERFDSFRGYPTLHACFVELGTRLAPRGRIAFLLPSPVADLDGYRPMRRTLTRTHRVSSELLEFGQDAFAGVLQPCFCLIADASPGTEASTDPFRLKERSVLDGPVRCLDPPEHLCSLHGRATFPRQVFRELGFQTNARVTKELLLRADAPSGPYRVALLEGRRVREFREGEPRLFLNPEPSLLRQERCRLRPLDEYRTVDFVIRQTARWPIAALHQGYAFRNSLLAGFSISPWSSSVLVGILNSTLIRAFHLATQRDARQKTFPQVKLAHLRALPAPSFDPESARRIEALVAPGSGRSELDVEREQLDRAVYAWYGFDAAQARQISGFFADACRGN